ncbi:MAG: MFS transporter, partial [Cyclobacteriaceae bacterium]
MTKFKTWLPLFATQFLGIFNDNLLKNGIIFIGILWLAEDQQELVISLATALLVLPFILFSPLAGRLAQQHAKQRIYTLAKQAEIPIMVLAAVGFFLQSIYLVMGAMLLMGVQSAIYSPSKFGLIRDVGGVEGLSFGNGTMELLSFVGVLVGQITAGMVSDMEQGSIAIISSILVALALLGWITSKQIKAQEAKPQAKVDDSLNPFKYIYDSFRWSKRIKGLNFTVFGLSGFWLVAALLQMNIYVHAPNHYQMSNTETAIVMALIAIGIAIGCWLAGLIARNRVELGIVPLGGIGLSICTTVMATADLNRTWFIVFLVASAFSSGFYKIPLNAWLQERVEGRKLGNILAYANMMDFLFVLLAAGIFGFVSSNYGTFAVFKVIAGVSVIMTIITLFNIPAMMVRFVTYLLTRFYFKFDINGMEHIPKRSGALLVANHVSLLDPFYIVATVPRMVRFVVAKEIYEHPLWHWFLKRLNMIPISGKLDKEHLEEFNALCQKEVNEGHVLCIFPEGQISRIGHLLEFKKGIEHIAKGTQVPIIPIQIEGVRNTPLSYETGSSKPILLPRSFRKQLTVSIGAPCEADSNAFQLRQKVQELNADTFARRLKPHHTLGHFFLQSTKKYKREPFFYSDGGPAISYGETLKKVMPLAHFWDQELEEQERVGILLAKDWNGLLVNLSLALAGRVAVNIDSEFTIEEKKQVIEESGIKVLVATKETGSIQDLSIDRLVHLEDLISQSSKYARKKQVAEGLISSNSLATIFFEKDDKGNLLQSALTHQNILANLKGLQQVYKLDEKGKMLGMFPLSSSYGYTLDLWLPIFAGIGLVLAEPDEDVPKLAEII